MVLVVFSATGCRQVAVREIRQDETLSTRPAQEPHALLGLEQLIPAIARPVNRQDIPSLSDPLVQDLQQAEQWLAQGKAAAGLPLFQKAQKEAPDHPRVLRGLGVAYAELDHRDNALEYLQKAVDSAPDDLEVQLTLSVEYTMARQHDKALLALRTALLCSQARDENPLLAETLLRLGNLLHQQGYMTAAQECFQRLSRLMETHGPDYAERPLLKILLLRPERLLSWRGELLAKIERYTEAAELLEQAFRYNRTHTKTARLLIETLIAVKQFSKAETLLLEIAEEQAQRLQIPTLAKNLCRNGDDPSAAGRLAEALIQRNLLDDALAIALSDIAQNVHSPAAAEKILESFLQKHPASALASRRLAKIYIRQGRHERALELLAEIVAQKPSAASTINLAIQDVTRQTFPVDLELSFALQAAETDAPPRKKAAMFYVAGQLAKAIDDLSMASTLLRKALEVDGKFLPSYEALIDIYLVQNDGRRIDRTLRQLADNTTDSFLLPYLRGKVYWSDRRLRKAIEQLTEARRRNADNIATIVLLGRCYQALGAGSAAAEAFSRAIKLQPDNEPPYRLLFDVYTAGKQYASASRVVDMLLRRNKESLIGRIMAAEILLRKGKLLEARQAIVALQKDAPGNLDVDVLNIQAELFETKPPLAQVDFQRLTDRLVELIRQDPAHATAKHTLAGVLAGQGPEAQTQTAEVWSRLYELTHRRSDIAKTYAAALYHLEHYSRAAEVLRQVTEETPHDLGSQRALIQTYSKLDSKAQAAEQCRIAQAVLDEWLATSENQKQNDFLQAQKLQLYILAEMYDDFAQAARQWITDSPDNNDLKKGVISMLVKAEQFDLAHQLLDEWISLEEQDTTSARQMKFSLYMEAKQREQAIASALQWAQHDPELILPRRMVIFLLAEDKQYERAEKLLQMWIELPEASSQPTTTTAPTTQATQPTTARATTRQTIQPTTTTQPTLPAAPKAVTLWSREWFARVLMFRGQYARAMDYLEQFVPQDPKNFDLLLIKSSCLTELGQDAEALEAMEAAYLLNRDDPEVNNNLAYLYAEMGIALDKAERLVRRALTDTAQQQNIQDTLAWIFYKKGRFAEAGRIFDQILAKLSDEDHAVIYDHAGDTMWRLGETEKALSLWRKALEQAETQDRTREIQRILTTTPEKIQAATSDQPPPLAPVGIGVESPPNSE